MAFRMPHPIILGNGYYHLNVRVPADLADEVKGGQVLLPVGGKEMAVGIRDKVILSLRTKDPRVAKARFAEAHAALTRHWQLVRAAPTPLTHKQVMSLAGLFYRQQVAGYERDPGLTPEALQAERDDFRAEVNAWRAGEDAERLADAAESSAAGAGGATTAQDDGYAEAMAAASALLSRPNGDALLAFRGQGDIRNDAVAITFDEALDRLFGPAADRLCRRLGIRVDAGTRQRVLREIGLAYRQAEAKMLRNMDRDYSDDPAASRFPAFEPIATEPTVPPSPPDIESVAALYERWSAKQSGRKSAATIRRYGPSLASLDSFVGGRHWRTLASDEVFRWATHRHEAGGVAPETVNKNDLVAASSILGWATTVNGKRRPERNAAFGVRVESSKRVVTREKFFRTSEITAILRLARSVKTDPRYPRASASRRWTPWLCAYSGARVQEPLWLKKSDIRVEAGHHVMCFSQTKDGNARMVPIHQALIDEGFLAFVEGAPDGWLFVGDRLPKEGATRTPQEMRAAELTHWVRSQTKLEKGVSPSHG